MFVNLASLLSLDTICEPRVSGSLCWVETSQLYVSPFINLTEVVKKQPIPYVGRPPPNDPRYPSLEI